MKILSCLRSGLAWLVLLGVGAPLSAEPAALPRWTDGEVIYQLFNGNSFAGWSKFNQSPVSKGWQIDDGALHRSKGGGHIYFSYRVFGDFDFSWEWKIAPGGNSGVKYRVTDYDGQMLGCEYQLLDDERHGNGQRPKTSAGALYALYGPNDRKQLRPVGQYNQSRIVARGSHLEHWLNGAKIVDADTSSADWHARVARSKFGKHPGFAQNQAGWIMLQDHGNEVWFRNLVLRPLDPCR